MPGQLFNPGYAPGCNVRVAVMLEYSCLAPRSAHGYVFIRTLVFYGILSCNVYFRIYSVKCMQAMVCYISFSINMLTFILQKCRIHIYNNVTQTALTPNHSD